MYHSQKSSDMGIPFSYYLSALWVRVTRGAHITRVLGMGMPISLTPPPSFPGLSLVLRSSQRKQFTWSQDLPTTLSLYFLNTSQLGSASAKEKYNSFL